MTAESIRLRNIKNLGPRPHNLPYSQVIEAIKNNENGGQYGVLMLKPECFLIGDQNTSIQDQVEDLLSANNLNVVVTACRPISKEQVHLLYPNIFGSDVAATSDRLGELRVLLEEYLSNCVFTYLVQGENTQRKLEDIKRVIRQGVARVGNWDVTNRIHVPDQEELTRDINILFSHNGCGTCLK